MEGGWEGRWVWARTERQGERSYSHISNISRIYSTLNGIPLKGWVVFPNYPLSSNKRIQLEPEQSFLPVTKTLI